jgi:hypothetical protein
MRNARVVGAVACSMIVACGGATTSSGGAGADAAKEAASEAGSESGVDAGRDSGSDVAAESGAATLGKPCVPDQEAEPTFTGFVAPDVNVESKNPSCGDGACLVNHFQGLTSCPYGQSSAGVAPEGATPCAVPGTSEAVSGNVAPQCSNRTATDAVYCSCRCANAEGKMDDGATYCGCPSGFTCAQLVTAIGPGCSIAGGYCIKTGTAYDMAESCRACDPTKNPCP